MIWQLKYDANYIDMPSPSSFKIDGEDLDLNSYRSVVNGNLIRNILGFKWHKLYFEFSFMYREEAVDLLNKVSYTYPLEIRIKSPFVSTEWKDLKGYVSKAPIEFKGCFLPDGTWGRGYVVGFNFIEAVR